MAILEISVVPIGTSTPSIGDYIADVVKFCNKAGVRYKLTDMGTIIEGRATELFKVAQKIHETPFKRGVKRVLTTISIDDRRDKRVKLEDKITSVMSRIEG